MKQNGQNKPSATIFRDAFILFIITLVAGLCLGFVYQITKEPIAKAEEGRKQKAYQQVFPGAAFEETEELKAFTINSADYFNGENIKGTEISEIRQAVDESGTLLGYVLTFVGKEGYGGNITMSMGINTEGGITGISVLSMSETPGLGAKCTDKSFTDQFSGIQADSIVYTKTGKSADNEIDALSGATITTNAVTDAINSARKFMREQVLPGREGR